MRILELFAGTGSIGKVCPNDEVISLDIIGQQTLKMDILSWNYQVYPSGYFDYIHASPPCQTYSKANPRVKFENRDFSKGDELVIRTLQIINYFQPMVWTIENPRTGYLKTRDFMQDLPFTDVDYCKYGLSIRKQTRIWNNINLKLDVCINHNCNASFMGNHNKMVHNQITQVKRGSERAIIPFHLCLSIINQVREFINKQILK